MAAERELGMLQGLSLALLAATESKAPPKVMAALRLITEQVQLSVAMQDTNYMKGFNEDVLKLHTTLRRY
jgi:hypothetical protein